MNQSQNNNQISTDDILNKDILELMGAKDMPDEKKKELYQKMLETIQNRVIARIDDMLTDEEAAEWKKIVDENNHQKNQEFLQRKNIDIKKLYTQELLIYKMEMVNLSRSLNKTKNG